MGRSPMHLTRCGFPSMPVMVSKHGRRLMRSLTWGWQCHEQPLSMTAQQIALATGSLILDAAALSARPTMDVVPMRARS